MEDDKALSEYLRHFEGERMKMSVGWRDNIFEDIF